MINIRKIVTVREVVLSELGHAAARPIVRAVGIGVIHNPFAGRWTEDLRPLFEAGAALGERLMPELVRLLDGPAVSYGKGALVGIAGEMEHGGACVHPMLGRPMRAAVGGGQAVISSNVKVASSGHAARRTARPQRRSVVIRAFRHDHSVGSGRAALRRDRGYPGNSRWRSPRQPLRLRTDTLIGFAVVLPADRTLPGPTAPMSLHDARRRSLSTVHRRV